FHAPPYGRFATAAPLCEALHAALSRPQGPCLTVATLPDMQISWMPDFMHLLRPHADRQALLQELADSDNFLRQLKNDHPERVHIRTLHLRPSLPVLIIDDSISFGHFAHSSTLTPDGFWCTVTAPVEELLRLATNPGMSHAAQGLVSEQHTAQRLVTEQQTAQVLVPEQHTAQMLVTEHRAALRLVEECVTSTCSAAECATLFTQQAPTEP
ncbi:MAG: hypothetical protein ACK5JO_02455, partial [Halodesulfovibrio sp.]